MTSTKKPANKTATQATKKTADPKTTPTSKKPRAKLFLGTILFILLLTLLGYKLFPYFVPALVNKKPITRWSVYKRMDKFYGKQVLDDIINEAILKQAIHDSGVKVSDDKVNQELSRLEKQFDSLGGLDLVLKQQGLTKEDLKDQIKTQLAVEEILKDKLNVTNEEVKQEYDKNKDTLYKDQQFEDVKDKIQQALRQDKLKTAFLSWFNEVKSKANVVRFNASK